MPESESLSWRGLLFQAKEKSYDPLNNLACLMPSWISKASAKQRRGRAGRVQVGPNSCAFGSE